MRAYSLPMPRLRSSALVLLLASCALSLAAGCNKKKKQQPEPVSLLTPTNVTAGLGSRCDGEASKLWDLTKIKAYALHADGTPSRAALFVNEGTTPKRMWGSETPKELEPWLVGTNAALDAELTVCVDKKEPSKAEGLVCSYYGAKATMKGREYTVKVVETATGKPLAEETFTTDPRVSLCPGSVTGSYTDYGNWEGRVAAILARLQPEAALAKLPKANGDDLYGVCTGTGLVQARKPGVSGALKVVYFPNATTSFTNEDVPKGLTMGSSDSDPSHYAYVMCVTGKPEKKKRSCTFLGTTNELGIYDGTFEVELREARTAKVVETKTFTGTSAGCPGSYKFKGPADQRILTIAPTFREWVTEVSAR